MAHSLKITEETYNAIIGNTEKVVFPAISTIANRLGYFVSRWSDEKEYEDFADYKTAIVNAFEGLGIGAKVTGVTKAFKITFTAPTLGNEVQYVTKVNLRSITTKIETKFYKAGV